MLFWIGILKILAKTLGASASEMKAVPTHISPKVKLHEKSHEYFLYDHDQYIEAALSHPCITLGRIS